MINKLLSDLEKYKKINRTTTNKKIKIKSHQKIIEVTAKLIDFNYNFK